jgi:hypothetical protein
MFFKKRERKIAIEVVDEIGRHLGNPLVGDPDFLRGIFASVCLRSNFIPTERDARRIFERVRDEMTLRQIKELIG